MNLLNFLLLLECLVQFSISTDSQQMQSFNFWVTISNISQNVTNECNQQLTNCSRIKEILCELSNETLPSKMYKSCSAQTVSGLTQGSMNWSVHLSLQTEFPNVPVISLSCQTFSELFNVSYMELPLQAFNGPFEIKVDSFDPSPTPYDPSMAKDAKYKVDAVLCDGDYNHIDVSECNSLNESYLMDTLKGEMLIGNMMGSFLFLDGNVTLSNLKKSVQEESCSLTLTVELPKSYVQELKIDPSCDVASILKLSFDDASDSTYTLCEATVTEDSNQQQAKD